MQRKMNKDWIYVVLVRALKTMAQTSLGMFTVGAAISEVGWMHILSVAFVSGVYSVLTSLSVGVEERQAKDGELLIDSSGETDIWRLDLGDELDNLSNKKVIVLKVDANADLSKPPFSRE